MHIDDVLKGVKPVVRTVPIQLDGSIENDRLRLEDELTQARRDDERENRTPLAPGIAEQLVELQVRARETEVEFTFTSIGRKAWTDLEAAHPPTPEQVEEAEKLDQVLKWNADTFPHAAIAASLLHPEGVDASKVAELELSLSVGQWKRLWACCVLANEGAGDVGFTSTASSILRDLERKSRRQQGSESPDPSSSEES